ncbi:hypothetical protein [Parachitinimonas caeni]|uniref:Uncharacterized protein n=1 Tax=Parachitinimonas caeni TaxID=3031301 RepID=A0ABT7E0I8_9NEIS|nr:hypothetical protein [Parachitinimonas caeni]MDK2125824.1 hypothetical protein [Parachitinimonas caeni]
MGFVEVNNWDDEPAKGGIEYSKAIELNGRNYPPPCWVDKERNCFLFVLSVQMNRERSPGECLLCVDGNLIHIEGYRGYEWVEEKEGYSHEYEIERFEVIGDSKIDLEGFIEIFKEAMLVVESRRNWNIVGMNIKIN